MPDSPARRNVVADGFIERHQTDAVTLHRQEIRERGRQRLCILDLGIRQRPEPHRLTLVDDQVTVATGFVLELFDVIPITACETFPIEAA